MVHDSIADIPEGDLVERLLADPHWRSRAFRLHGIPAGCLDLQKVNLADAPGLFEGDADVLLCPPNAPALATAIEVKRVKFGADAVLSGRPNKLPDLEKGIRQANRLSGVGFSQVYLFVLVVIDSRDQNAGTTSWDSISRESESLVERVISAIPSKLEPRIGLYRTDYIQPRDKAPLTVGMFSGHFVRPAQAVPQTPELTQWMAQKLAAKRQ